MTITLQKSTNTKKANSYKATEYIINLEIQTHNVARDLNEIILNHLNEHQKMKLAYALGLDQCECIKSTALEEII